MKKKALELDYRHPEIRVLSVSSRQVLCQSIVEKYEIDNELGDRDFE